MSLNHNNLRNIKGILADLDGTLYFKDQPIPGTKDSILKLKQKGIKLLFFTNTDSKSPESILRILRSYGFDIQLKELFTPIIALREFLSKNPDDTIFLVTTEEIKNEFKDFTIIEKFEDSVLPNYVIIGDFRDNWDVHRLNDAFKYVMKGSKLLGTQGNRFFLDKTGEPVIDTGSFIKLIAVAANVEPLIFGKPTREYFLQALEKIQLRSEEVIVIGDDIESDIQGAINVGIRGILVKTGKGKDLIPDKLMIKPYKIIESFNSIVERIN